MNANLVESQKIIDTKVLGRIVRDSRRALKLTQNQLAGICSVGARFVSELENGKETVEFVKVLQVLNSLGLELRLQKKGWS